MKRFSLALAILSLALLPLTAPSSAAPNEAQNYKLFGTMQRAIDPENPDNEVISSTLDVSNPDAIFAGAIRKLDVRVERLDNQVQLKYFFVPPRSCGGGSPRIQLAVDLNGDGRSDGNAFGYVGQPFNFNNCAQSTWVFEDLTDNNRRWDLSQFTSACNNNPNCPPASGFVVTWQEMETFFASFPTHKVLTGALVDDTFGGAGQLGTAYYDNLTIGKRTLDGWEDTTAK
jgi:hypothetical protein